MQHYCGVFFFIFILLVENQVACQNQNATLPGARSLTSSWIYKNKDVVWLFGGLGLPGTDDPGRLQDVWQYKINNNTWSWSGGTKLIIQRASYNESAGIFSPTNIPFSLIGATTWTDRTSNLWLFGGYGFDNYGTEGTFNQIWKYNAASSGEWAFIWKADTRVNSLGNYDSKSAYEPASRFGAVSWTIDEMTYIFGGQHNFTGQHLLNDLWVLNMTNNRWTLIGGSYLPDQLGIYGVQGQSSSNNIPGARFTSVSSIDPTNRDYIWLFGGYGFDSNGNRGLLNDLWRYQISTRNWTWISGSNATNQPSEYDSDPRPGGRAGAVSWTKCSDVLILFGGCTSNCQDFVSAISLDSTKVNDLWEYNITSNEWRLLSGRKNNNSLGSYGIQGQSSRDAIPGARLYSNSWTDSKGYLWLFGGVGIDSRQYQGYLNDLWKYDYNDTTWTWISGFNISQQVGNYGSSPSFLPVTPSDTLISDYYCGAVLSPESSPLAYPASENPNSDDVGQFPTWAVAPIVVGPVVITGVALGIYFGKKRRTKQKPSIDEEEELPRVGDTKLIAIQNPLKKDFSDLPVKMFIPFVDLVMEELLGIGSFGQVYAGRWEGLKVALKISLKNVNQVFISEIKLVTDMRPHPNIVQLLGYSVHQDTDNLILVMEYCNGGSMDSLLFDSNEPIEPTQKLSWIKQVALGLNHLHLNGIIHRDIASRNILLSNNTAKLSDFGMSRQLEQHQLHGTTKADTGPIRWMAPESIKSKVYSAKTDVWMFGILIYEIMAQQEPHVDKDPLEIGIRIRDEGFAPLIPEDTTPIIRNIMENCWHHNPEERPSMTEIIAMLEN